MDLRIGCCGWAVGRSKYFQDFPVVEIQSTFYQPPSPELAAKWRKQAPPDFVFTLKAWQLTTHPASSPTYRKLKQPVEANKAGRYGHFRPTDEVWDAWRATENIAQALRAAVIVFQCPPKFEPTPENRANVGAFFRKIDRRDWLIAWEPRGPWEPDQVRELCRSLDLIHCVDPFSTEPTHGQTAYFRLHGRGGYRYRYTDADLSELRKVCEQQHRAGCSPVYVMFNNTNMREDAKRLQKLVQGVCPKS